MLLYHPEKLKHARGKIIHYRAGNGSGSVKIVGDQHPYAYKTCIQEFKQQGHDYFMQVPYGQYINKQIIV
jgi:hypothetical protein